MVNLYVVMDSREILRMTANESAWVALVDANNSDISVPAGCILNTSAEIEKEMLKLPGSKSIDRKILEWLKEVPNRPAKDGKSLKQLLEFQGTSLWWFGESIGRYTTLREAFTRVEAVMHFIEKHHPSHVYISGGKFVTGLCAVAVCDSLKIPRTELGRVTGGTPGMNPTTARYAKKARSLARFLLCRIHRKKFKPTGQASAPLLLMSYYHSLKPDPEAKSLGALKDVILHPIINALEVESKPARTMYIDSSYPFGMASIKQLRAPAFPMDLYYKPFNRSSSKQTRELKKLWKSLKGSPKFQNSLAYGQINMWPLLKDHFAFLFLKQYPEAVECLDTMDRMLLSERPKALILSDEVGFYGRILVTACRKFNIKTLGIQHGAIDENHIEYIHADEGPVLPCPIPDVTAVWGEKDKRLIVESGLYSDANVKVTGSPRYDYLAEAGKIYSKDRIHKHFNTTGEKLVSVTTQPFHIFSEREQWLRAVASASKQLGNAFFVVKPHPAENPAMHEEICKKYGGANIAVSTDVDTNELIYASDMMITSHSTTGLESLILGTPLMTLNLTGMADPMPYASSGAAVGVYNEEDIAPAIKSMLDGKFPPRMDECIKQYIREYAYMVDGKASKRVVSIIDGFPGQKTSRAEI